MAAATGADLPNETISRVLGWLKEMLSESPDHAQRRLRRRQLGMLSLVCKFWARNLRHHIFSSIELRTSDDFDHLLALLDYPSTVVPTFSSCLFSVRIIQSGAWERPWLHHIRAELLKRPLRCKENGVGMYVVTLESTSAKQPKASVTDKCAPSSFSTHLPRTLPRAFFPFGTLTLTDLHFQRPSDMLRLVDVADLGQLRCSNITFEAIDWTPIFRRRKPQLGVITLSRVGDVSQAVHFAAFMLWHLRKDLSYDAFAWNSIRDVVVSLLPSGGDHSTEVAIRASDQSTSPYDVVALATHGVYQVSSSA